MEIRHLEILKEKPDVAPWSPVLTEARLGLLMLCSWIQGMNAVRRRSLAALKSQGQF